MLIVGKLPSYKLSGELEANESYFGGARKGKRDRGGDAAWFYVFLWREDHRC